MAARIVQPAYKHHTFRLVEGDRELLLVGTGRSAYLWTGPTDGTCAGVRTYSGPQTLRKLALAILDAIPPSKPRAKRAKK